MEKKEVKNRNRHTHTHTHTHHSPVVYQSTLMKPMDKKRHHSYFKS